MAQQKQKIVEEVYSKEEVDNRISDMMNMQIPTHNSMDSGIDFLNPESWKNISTVSQSISRCSVIPKIYANNPANCVVALSRAKALNVDVFWLMSVTAIINGELHFEGKAVVGLANRSGVFKDRIYFDESGDISDPKTFKCVAHAELSGSNRYVECEVTYQMAIDFGWVKPLPVNEWRNGKKIKVGEKPGFWQMMPRQMLIYRSGSWLVNAHCPEVVSGLKVAEFAFRDSDEQKEEVRAPLFAPREETRKDVVEPKKEEKEKPKPEEKQASQPATKPLSGSVDKKEKANNEELADATKLALKTIVDAFKKNKINHENFNKYLVESLRWLAPGDIMEDLTTARILLIVKDLPSVMSTFRAWEKGLK